ncbi:MAG: hypothetical protein M3O31_17465 [Acidobacteriota bacterium]|nr:hypothetical protein [Acidobacteriota bacterium]
MLNRRSVRMAAAAVFVTLAPLAVACAEQPSAVHVTDCDRACLQGFVDDYMKALLNHDPKSLRWAENAKFTENNVPLQPGDGLWGTIDRQGAYRLYFCDPETGNVGFFGTVEENGSPSVFSLRMKIVGKTIAEAETIVVRKATNGFAEPESLRDKAILNEDVPPPEQETRERLITSANSYFETLQQNNGLLYAQFDPTCNRIEDGVQTTNNPNRPDKTGLGIMKLSCAEAFKTGYFRYVTRIRDRRFLVVDQGKGLVFASAFFDHSGALKKETLSDGREVTPQFTVPWTWLIGELFRVKNGKIVQIEALVLKVPYNTVSFWQ